MSAPALFFLPSYAVLIATARQYAVPEVIRESASFLRELSLLNYVLNRPATPEGQWMIFAFAAPGMAPATCSSIERLHNTISSLGLLPLGGKAIYDGWKRGGSVRRAEGWIVAGVIFPGLVWNDALGGMGWALAAVVAAYALPPIFFLESLRELSNGRGVLRSLVGIGIYWSVQLVGVLPVGIVVSVAAILYRPRAIRLMDELFDEASVVVQADGTLSRAFRARETLARMSAALFRHTNVLGWSLWCAM